MAGLLIAAVVSGYKARPAEQESVPAKPKKKSTETPKQEPPKEKAADVLWENLQKKKRL